jgi:uncharacterized protein with GYD domain
MPTYVLLTRLSPGAVKSPKDIEKLEKEISSKIKAECPKVRWSDSYAILGPHDYLDIFEAPDEMTAAKVVMIVRSFGHATTEIWTATKWDRFKELFGKAA